MDRKNTPPAPAAAAATAAVAADLTALYHRSLAQAGHSPNREQLRVLNRFQELAAALTAAPAGPLRQRLRRLTRHRPAPLKGAFLWGQVGGGKTFLMDLFYDALSGVKKRRLHFYRFMEEVHAQLKAGGHRTNPVKDAALHFSRGARVLCIDEFHITNITDAMIMHRFLDALFSRDTVLIATSNTAPADLYKGGLQYERFVPAIELLEAHTEVLCLNPGTDYRAQYMRKAGTYFHPHDKATREMLGATFFPRANGTGAGTIRIHNRSIPVQNERHGTVWFDFAAICDGPRSIKDYIAIANLYGTVIISAVPVFDNCDDRARRFIHLIDEFYDRNVRTVLLADAAIDDLYRNGNLTAMFRRTASRLQEMQSEEYLSRSHQIL